MPQRLRTGPLFKARQKNSLMREEQQAGFIYVEETRSSAIVSFQI